MGRVVDIQSAVTFAPTSYSNNTFTSSYYQNLDNGLNPHDGTNSMVHKVFKKQLDPKDDTVKWVEQSISRNIFDTTKIYKTEKVTD